MFAVQNLAAAQLSRYWQLSQVWQVFCFYVFTPITIILINFAGVFWFGVVETAGGILKVVLVFGVSIMLFAIAGISQL